METISAEQLVDELWAWDVRFIMGKPLASKPPILPPKILIVSLAKSSEARMRLSLIPLLLRHPEFANEGIIVDNELLTSKDKLVFRFYFTAAMILQEIYKGKLLQFLGEQPKIPDSFSSKLGISFVQDPEINLFILAQRHKVLSGQHINWLGTYYHATDVWLKALELQFS